MFSNSGIFLWSSPRAYANHVNNSTLGEAANSGIGFGLMELPFLFLCIYFAFKTAYILKGGVFGKGMNLMAWGFLIMAVGHIHMQLDHILGYNLFNLLFGTVAGNIVWFIALIITWSLSGWGFYSIYKASKG